MSDEEPQFGLVMPFVSVESVGGPYEDSAYAAGWAMGALDAELRMYSALGGTPPARYLAPADHAQIDLIAMRHGYTITTVPAPDTDGAWTLYQFAHEGETS